ncbi:Maf1 regulator [Giardia muris]|uniref:Maf1 regulator n=1 Tax=Giardia muris TaxID=5742 RepID=A0A4Z1T6V7_GIAMU|nr:Maf1 regulator [Giardia muris]|eukprot:TNJ28867.1 Maf1 regulator [Giardia muris]
MTKLRSIQAPGLLELADGIQSLSCNGLCMRARLELYNVRAAPQSMRDPLETDLQIQIARNYGSMSSNGSPSPFGSLSASITSAFKDEDLTSPATCQTYVQLCQVLNQAYPRFDFGMLQPSSFFRMPYSVCQAALDNTLMSTLENYHTLRPSLWVSLMSIVPPPASTIYTVDPAPHFPFEEEDGVWSQNFIFFNEAEQVVLLFVLKAVPDTANEQCYPGLDDVDGVDHSSYLGDDDDEDELTDYLREDGRSEMDDIFPQYKLFQI